MDRYVNQVCAEFKKCSNADNALAMKAYMKNKFEFYGVKSPERKQIQKFYFSKAQKPQTQDIKAIIINFWNQPQRECQYFAQELLNKYAKQFKASDIQFLETLIINKSWWDSVDFIASNLLGKYFKKFPKQKEIQITKWLESGNIWLQRSALLFQLKYKKELDTELLTVAIHSLLGSKEFFINKAIGWALREYSKVNPQWVEDFCSKTKLEKLSLKEGLRLIRTG